MTLLKNAPVIGWIVKIFIFSPAKKKVNMVEYPKYPF